MESNNQVLTLERQNEQQSQIQKENTSLIDFKMVTFSLSGKDYSIDIMHIKEIAKAGRFTYVPNTLPFVLGVYNLRGEIIPILDLRLFFNIEVPERAFHKSFRKYKNELDREVIASKEELQTVKEALDYYDVFEDGNAFMKQAHQDSKLLDELYKEYPDYYNELVSRVSSPEKDVSDLEER